MATSSEIKSRIGSVTKTKKITNAMYLIASTKLRRARKELENTRPYFTMLRKEIRSIFLKSGEIESKYFYPEGERPKIDGTYGILVITADKGLAGAYNHNVIKETEIILNKHPDSKLFVVGEFGRRYYEQRNIPIEQSFLYTAQNPSLDRAREISSLLLDMFESDEITKIYIVYTDMENSVRMNVNSNVLLPFSREHFKDPNREYEKPSVYEFFPSTEAVLESLVQSYLTGFVYSALVDSFCSEQNSRMTAMDAANKNAEELLGNLSLQYNRVRQADITQEITEVSAGAMAQRNNR